MMSWTRSTTVPLLLVMTLVGGVHAKVPVVFTQLGGNDCSVYGILSPPSLPGPGTTVSLAEAANATTCSVATFPTRGEAPQDTERTPDSVRSGRAVIPAAKTQEPELTSSPQVLSENVAAMPAGSSSLRPATEPGHDVAVARLPTPTRAAAQAARRFSALEAHQMVTSVEAQGTKSLGAMATGAGDRGPAAEKAMGSTGVMSAVQAAMQHELEGNLCAAINSFHQALLLDDTDRRALLGFARLKHRLGDLDGALVTYRQSLKHHPNDAVALNDLALCYARMGQFDAAEESLRTALNLEPMSRRYVNNLAKVLVEQDKDGEALQLLTGEYGEALANYNLGYIQMSRSAHEDAAHYLRTSLELDPSFRPAKELLRQLGPFGRESAPELDFTIRVVPERAEHELEPTAAEAPSPRALSIEEPAVIQRVHGWQQRRTGGNFLQP